MTNIVFLDAGTVGSVQNIKLIKELGHLDIYDQTRSDQIIERAEGKEIIITNKVRITPEIMDKLPGLKLICVTATGMDNIDIEYAGKKGIQVKNVAGYSTDSVAQHTFTVLLYLTGKPAYYDQYVKSGSYSQSDYFTHIGNSFRELKGKKIGIIGLGTIGRQVAKIADAFGMEVIYYSTTGNNNNKQYNRYELDELLKSSDIVTIHAPLSGSTRGLITYDKIKLMKPDAILINMGRGGIINEADLARALNENLIAAAGLDVLEQEPIKADHPLLKLKDPGKIFITPHIAWTSIEARELLIRKIAENIEKFLKQ